MIDSFTPAWIIGSELTVLHTVPVRKKHLSMVGEESFQSLEVTVL